MKFLPKISVFILILYSAPLTLNAWDAAELLKDAREAIRKGNYQKSATIVQVILEKDPSNMKALKLLEKAFDIKIKRQKLEDKLIQSIKNKNLPTSMLNFRKFNQKDPFNPRLDDYREKIKKLKKEDRFSAKQLNLSKTQEQKREKLLAKAKLSMEEKRYSDALTFYQKLLEMAPGDLIAQSGIEKAQQALDSVTSAKKIKKLLKKGQLEYNEKKYLAAKNSFEKILILEPRHKKTILWLEKIDLALKQRREKDNEAIQAEVFYNEAISFFRKREYGKAIDSWEKALIIIPDYRDTNIQIRKASVLKEKERIRREKQRANKIANLIQKGLVAYYAEDFENAISSLGAALKIEPNNKYAKQTLELARDAQKLKSEEEVNEDSPFYPLLLTFQRKANNYFKNKKYQLAKKEWIEILLLFPKNRLAIQESLRCDKEINPEVFRLAAKKIIEEGKKLLKRKSFRPARKKFLIIKQIVRNFPDIDKLIAKTRESEKKSQKAKLPKPTLRRYYNNALTAYRAGKLSLARDWFQKIADNDPMNFKAIASLARIQKLMAIGKGAAGTQKGYLSKKQRLQVKKLYILGLTQYSNNNYRKAIQAWKKVLAIDPKNLEARANIIRVKKLLRS